MYKILIAEDNESLGYVLKEYLGMNGYEVTLVINAEDAMAAFKKQHYDLCLLDVILPGSSGFDAAVKIKACYPIVPIIFLTARALKVDKIKGFRIGADDYIIKPVDEEELLMRIQSVIKRVYPQQAMNRPVHQVGAGRFEFANRVLVRNEQRITLTDKEAERLQILCEHRGNLVSRHEIQRRVWGDSNYFIGRTMDVHLSKLRKLLAVEPQVQIVNVHGRGFVLVA